MKLNTAIIWCYKTMIKVLFICVPRQDMYRTSKNPVKSRVCGIQKPPSTPFSTPNFFEVPDMTVRGFGWWNGRDFAFKLQKNMNFGMLPAGSGIAEGWEFFCF